MPCNITPSGGRLVVVDQKGDLSKVSVPLNSAFRDIISLAEYDIISRDRSPPIADYGVLSMYRSCDARLCQVGEYYYHTYSPFSLFSNHLVHLTLHSIATIFGYLQVAQTQTFIPSS